MKSKFYLILHDYQFVEDIQTNLVEGTRFPLYTCFREASSLLKKLENSRFKVFDTKEKAIAYAKYHQKLSFNNDESNYKRNTIKVSKLSSVDLGPIKNLPFKDEKLLPFSHPTSSQICQLRDYIHQDKTDDTFNIYLQNPRLLMSTSDTPVILQEGARYHAIHICARTPQDKLLNVCAVILDMLGKDLIYQKLYPEDSSTNLYNRKMHLIDLYLNNRDKMLYDTPLHMACKFGNVAIVKLLASHPLIHKFCLNAEGKSCHQVICDRYKRNDKEIVSAQIRHILEDNYYVPVLRDVMPSVLTKQNQKYFKLSSMPRIGRPFVWNNLSPTIQHKRNNALYANDQSLPSDSLCNFLQSSISEDCLSMNETFAKPPPKEGLLVGKIDALAGPMSFTKALDFFKICNSAKKAKGFNYLEKQSSLDNPPFSKHLTPNDITKTDPLKGLEILGRQLAKSMNIPWAERWGFLNDVSVPKLAYRDEDTQNLDECLTDISIFNDGEMSYPNQSFRENGEDSFDQNLSDFLNFVDVTSPKGLTKLESHFKQFSQTDQIRKSLFDCSFESKRDSSLDVITNDSFVNIRNRSENSSRSSSNDANRNLSNSSDNSSIIRDSQFLKWRESKTSMRDDEFENVFKASLSSPTTISSSMHETSNHLASKIVWSPTLANETNLCTFFQNLSLNCPNEDSVISSQVKTIEAYDGILNPPTANSFFNDIFLNVKSFIFPVTVRQSRSNETRTYSFPCTLKNLIFLFFKNKHNVKLENDEDRYYTPPSSPLPNLSPVYMKEKLYHNISQPLDNHFVNNPSPQLPNYVSSTPYNSKMPNDYFHRVVSQQSVTQKDFDLYIALIDTDIVPHKYPYLARWFHNIKEIYKLRKMTPRKWIKLEKQLHVR